MATKKPAKKASPRTLTLPDIKKGEVYAGVMVLEGTPANHIILLPGEATGKTHDQAVAWAKKHKGELPTRREQALLFASTPEHFKHDYYWSCETHAADAASADYAWRQDFGYGDQISWHKSDKLRARAVRRVVI